MALVEAAAEAATATVDMAVVEAPAEAAATADMAMATAQMVTATVEMEKEAKGEIDRVVETAETEKTTVQKRKKAGQEKQSKRSREDEKHEEWMLAHLLYFRTEWTGMWADHFGDVEKRTEVPPMQCNQGPVPPHANLYDALQIFSVRVIELKGIMSWPIDVFGLIAVRDSVDHNRNYIFERSRDSCQALTAKDSSLVLTGPSRAVLLCDPVDFEVELRVKGKIPSEDKLLSTEVFAYNCISQEGRAGSLREYMSVGLRCTLEFRYAHLPLALEAAIKVRIAEGSNDFCGKFVARTASINENVTLLDSREGMVSISDDGIIDFSRSVVVIEGLDGHGKLIVGVEARQSSDDETSRVCKEVTFILAKYGESHGTFDVGFCKMSVVVSWSLINW